MMRTALYSMRAKLRSASGETLTEALAGIIIGGLAILILGMAISSATTITRQSDTVLNDYFAANNQLVASNAENGSGIVTLTDSSNQTVKLEQGADAVDVGYVLGKQADGTVIATYEIAQEGVVP